MPLSALVNRTNRAFQVIPFTDADLLGPSLGSEVMSRIAAPMVGGMVLSTVLTLAVIPAIYALVKQWRLKRGLEA